MNKKEKQFKKLKLEKLKNIQRNQQVGKPGNNQNEGMVKSHVPSGYWNGK